MKNLYCNTIMQASRKIILFILTLTISGSIAFSQQTQVKGAYGGSKGIFVYLKALTPSNSDKIAYCSIERRETGSGDWKSIATCRKPMNESDFTRQLKNSVDNLPYDASFILKKSKAIWKKYVNATTQDSLRLWFSTLPVQEALGIVYQDLTAKQGTSYEYRIQQFDLNSSVINTLLYLPAKYPGEKSKWNVPYRSNNVLPHQVTVTWGTTGGKMPPYSKVYRQDRNGGDWAAVNTVITSTVSKDSVYISATDTLVVSGAVYRYKLVPMDIFGNPGTETESEMIGAYNFRMEVPVIEDLKSSNPESTQGILLSWSISHNDLVNSIFIYRSDSYDGEYAKIAEVPSVSISYTDQTVEPNRKYYYMIRLTGPMGELSAPSSRIFAISDDRSKPAPPMITSAEGTSKGIQLTVKVTERNLSGVRIFRNSQDNRTMIPVTNLLAAKDLTVIYEDTANISPVKFYGYTAISENASHLQGNPSDTVYARSSKPYTLPVVIGLVADNRGTHNQLYWNDMHFIEAPVEGYNVYRGELPSGELKQINDTIISAGKNSFTDRAIEPGKTYLYSVTIVDGFGKTGAQCTPVKVSPETVPVRPPSTVSANSEADFIRISWNIVQSPTLKEYKVFRYTRGNKPSAVGSLPAGAVTEYSDKDVIKGQLYFYYIVTVDSDGRQSNPSKEISIRKE
ncbi:MAG TPA: hypothetical protein PKH02_04150 [Bacteroidales bacterium]|nr:hypothetical protein [Bacteroidales bacterium]